MEKTEVNNELTWTEKWLRDREITLNDENVISVIEYIKSDEVGSNILNYKRLLSWVSKTERDISDFLKDYLDRAIEELIYLDKLILESPDQNAEAIKTKVTYIKSLEKEIDYILNNFTGMFATMRKHFNDIKFVLNGDKISFKREINCECFPEEIRNFAYRIKIALIYSD